MRNLARHLFWLFLLQGVVLVALGILVLIYPAILFGLVAGTFVWNGAMMIAIAWRVRSARGSHEVREFIEAVT